MPIPLSILDLVPVGTGDTAAAALRRIVDLARLADRLGFVRYWFAEHHGMPGIASSAPELLIAHAAAATFRIRVGSGGIMLPNHVPLQVAEDFQTLEALHPGRIDLGIGRAPGTDQRTIGALRSFDAEQFPQHLAELLALSRGEVPAGHPFHSIVAVPSGVPLPPIWLLGSSGASARMAGELGMGYAFASHFSPTDPVPAMRAYREAFRPSESFPEPHAILAVSVITADTAERAEFLAATMGLVWVRIRKGEVGPLPSPEEALAYSYTPEERAIVEAYRSLSHVGTPDAIRRSIEALVRRTEADEVMVTANIHSHPERLRSFELVAEAFEMAPSIS